MHRPVTQIASFVSRDVLIASIALLAIAIHLTLRLAFTLESTVYGVAWQTIPLLFCLVFGGIPLVAGLVIRLVQLKFSSDLLAGISIVTSVVLGEYLAGTLVVLMLSGGQALEAYAVRRASSALAALAKRMPSKAHRKQDGTVSDVALDEVAVDDLLVVFPHETCPVDGVVVEGRSTMNESYLTGEPYLLPKVAGSAVLSGAINGDGALTIRAEKNGCRFAICQDHAGHARVGTATARVAAARRSNRRHLYATCNRHRLVRLVRGATTQYDFWQCWSSPRHARF